MDSLSDMVPGLRWRWIAMSGPLRDLGRWAGSRRSFIAMVLRGLQAGRASTSTPAVGRQALFPGPASPAAAALVTGFIWIMTDAGHDGSWPCWLMFAITLYAGLTMVTNAPFYSFRDLSMKKKRAVCRHRVGRWRPWSSTSIRRDVRSASSSAMRQRLRPMYGAQGQGSADQRDQHHDRRTRRVERSGFD